jgi:hypothetical protein
MNDRSTSRPRLKKQAKKAILEIAVLAVVILAIAIAARLVGHDTSMLPWNW